MLLFDVTMQFAIEVKKQLQSRKDLMQFILNHERKSIFLNNVCNQVQTYEQRYQNRITRKGRDQIIQMAATMFINTAIKDHEEKRKTEAQQIVQNKERREYEEMSEILKEVPENE